MVTMRQRLDGLKIAFGFPALEQTTGRRRSTTTRTTHELYQIPGFKRQQASATARDQKRAFNILAWMIRKHLSNVSRFTPHVDTGDDAVDAALLKCLAWHALPVNFDALGKVSRDEWMYSFEGCKAIAGDCGAIKVQGLKVQGIEGDRIAVGQGVTLSAGYTWFNGHWVSEDGLVFEGADDPKADPHAIQFGGRVRGYAVCRRTGIRGNLLTLERIVPAENFIFDSYWPERFDSNRGVSPLLPALNECADVLEAREFMLLKIKIGALFGWGFKRAGEDEVGNGLGAITGQQAATIPPNGATPTTTERQNYLAQVQRSIDMRGPVVLDLDPGDDMAEIESSSPNPEFVPFTREVIRSILLALDLPFTMFDSMASSYSANEQARNEFDEACAWKRDKNEAVLRSIYSPDFVLGGMVALDLFGLSRAMKKAGMDVVALNEGLDWYPTGRPQPTSDEVKTAIMAIGAGLDSPQRFCARHGTSADEVVRETIKFAKKYGKDHPLLWAQGGQETIRNIMAEPARQDTVTK